MSKADKMALRALFWATLTALNLYWAVNDEGIRRLASALLGGWSLVFCVLSILSAVVLLGKEGRL